VLGLIYASEPLLTYVYIRHMTRLASTGVRNLKVGDRTGWWSDNPIHLRGGATLCVCLSLSLSLLVSIVTVTHGIYTRCAHILYTQDAVFRKLLEREIAFYDRTGPGEIGSYLSQVCFSVLNVCVGGFVEEIGGCLEIDGSDETMGQRGGSPYSLAPTGAASDVVWLPDPILSVPRFHKPSPACIRPTHAAHTQTQTHEQDLSGLKDIMYGNLQRDRGLRAVLEAVIGTLLLFKLQPRLGALFSLVIPTVATVTVRVVCVCRGRRGANYGKWVYLYACVCVCCVRGGGIVRQPTHSHIPTHT
jgi:ABC-type multidrug transport system fused ATPase/permease subunit